MPAKSETRKFYFRASKPAPKAEMRFALPSGEVVVPIEIWGFEDLRKFRKLKGVQLPRRWPLGERLPELKQKQIFPTGAEAKTPEDQGPRRMARLLGRRHLGHAARQHDSPLALDEHRTRLPDPWQGDLSQSGLLSLDHGLQRFPGDGRSDVRWATRSILRTTSPTAT